MLGAMSGTREQLLEERLIEIESALENEDWDRALSLATEGQREHPGSAWLFGYAGEALVALGDYEGARDAYTRAVAIEPQSPELHEVLIDIQFRLGDFKRAREAAERALGLHPESGPILDLSAYIAERDGDLALADSLLARAHEVEPDIVVPVRMTRDEFRATVTQSLELLPDEFQQALDKNLAIVVEPVPVPQVLRAENPPLDPTILGYYAGVPLPEREPAQAPPELPDVIYLFQHNLEHVCGDREQLVDEIATTLYHEVAHFFGFEEEEMEGLGLE
jgi:predicted Zn-dependent protease with MMP-like domain